ncbi:MAG: branched-chain amino acid aminotransferase [Planctomycetes bacterium]|nr:branched-chain amino acid aminotransferase [Planctomycetota bacterium]
MTTQRQVYLNGQFVPEAEARISIFDSALMFGDMAFEMSRTFAGKPFRLRDHLERLYLGLRVLQIDCGMTIDEMEAATLQTLEVNRACFPAGLDAQIMHDVSRGPLPLYRPVFPEGLRPTVTINCWPLTWHLAHLAAAYETGLHAVIPPQRSVPARLIDPKVKNRSRVYYQLANLQAQRVDPKAWALLTDEDGFITEGTGSNFFLVKSGELVTPEPRNVLRGVTRKAVMELAAQVGLPCRECNLEPYDVLTADEAFFTATSFSILPVTRFNGQPIGDGAPGPVTRRLIAAWSETVGADIVAQAREYAKRVAEGRAP